MREISSLELYRIAHELSFLEGSYLRKFYETGKGEFELLFYKSEPYFVYVKLLKSVNLTKYVGEHEKATQFAMQIRKRLENRKLEKVYQYNTDRILIFEFGEYKLILEMFAKGNLILVDKEMKIIAPYKRIEYKERKIDYNELYKFPARGEVQSTGKLIAVLSKKFDMGPIYVEDAILRHGLMPDENIENIDAKKMEELEEYISGLRERALESKPLLYIKEQEYSLFPLEKYKGSEAKEYDSLSSLLDDFYISERGKEEKEEDKEREAIRKSIEQQKALIEKLEEEEKTYREIAEMILYNINELNELIDYIKRSRKPSVEELNAISGKIKVKGIDLKNKRVKVEVSS